MYTYAHLIIVFSVVYFIISYSLFSKYKKSNFHRVNSVIFFVIGTFFLFNGFIALANDKQQAWQYSRFLVIGHFFLPFLNYSLQQISEKKTILSDNIKRWIIFIPFILMALLDLFFPDLTYADPVLTRWGWVYSNKYGNNIFVVYNIVYLFYALSVEVSALVIYFHTQNRIKKKFLLFLQITYLIPFVIFIIMTHLYEHGTNFNIPFFFYVASVYCILLITFVRKYSVFDIIPEAIIGDIISNVTNMVVLLDLKENVILCNDVALDTINIKKEKIYKENFSYLLSENISIKTIVRETESKKGYRTYLRYDSGPSIPVLITASEIKVSDQSIGYLVLINDITRLQRLTDEKRFYELELSILQSQMNPHFIFNSLNAVITLLNKENKELTQRYILRLSSLFRKVLEHTGKRGITIEEEIYILKNYLEIESLRMGDNFNYEIDIVGGDDAYIFEIPPMIIQPLVENALWHGLSKIEGQRTLKILFQDSGAIYKISVIDNGIGIKKVSTLTYNEGHNGKSIKNISERLDLYNKYNEDYEVSFSIFDNSELKNKESGTSSVIEFKLK